jgi:hypothetical protein
VPFALYLLAVRETKVKRKPSKRTIGWTFESRKADQPPAVTCYQRMTDPVNQSVFEAAFIRPGLRKSLWFHRSSDPELLIEDGDETWYLGREKLTKDGMVLRAFSPWELRKNMTDGSDLYLLPEQEAHFRCSLPPECWPHMPPVRDPRPHFIRGERVQVAGHKGILVGWDRSVGPGHEAFPRRESICSAEMERIYSETCEGHVLCHRSFITKLHREDDTVFAFGLNENILILQCDHLRQEVKIQLRVTAARIYKKEPLVSSSIQAFLSTNLPTGKSHASELVTIPTTSW